MKKYIVLFLLLPLWAFSQKTISKEEKEVQKFQKELNDEYFNPKETPLRGVILKISKDIHFFPLMPNTG
ncbi:hypothetical protein [Chryseobacterium gleum]|uniref:hypothetical protein n=1 Tax=Chryseobacterium gleum TaxID=250 RepID=UPI00289EE39C|nr:hypothetical protein [Chryseobacterium gleum]